MKEGGREGRGEGRREFGVNARSKNKKDRQSQNMDTNTLAVVALLLPF